MPTLEKIIISNFRNIEFQELEFASNVNCISGNNGEGKTNLLDAIYYLSMTKSALNGSDTYVCRHGAESFSVSGIFRMADGLKSRFSISVGAGGVKKVCRDEKQTSRLSSHIGLLPIVMVSPSDISLVSESGEERRRFANGVLSQMERPYLEAAQQYNRLLTQRNSLLKSGNCDTSLLEVFDMKMDAPAKLLHQSRKRFVEQLQPSVAQYYSILSGGSEDVGIEYKSDLAKGSMSEILESCRAKDFALGYTSAGVQRDDLIFTMNSHPIRRFGSQGQQKSFLVALKFAQYEIMKRSYGFAPILLLDDVFDKLDMNRISNLLEMVSGNDFGQIFITDSNKVRISGIVDSITSDRAYFETVAGKYKKI